MRPMKGRGLQIDGSCQLMCSILILKSGPWSPLTSFLYFPLSQSRPIFSFLTDNPTLNLLPFLASTVLSPKLAEVLVCHTACLLQAWTTCSKQSLINMPFQFFPVWFPCPSGPFPWASPCVAPAVHSVRSARSPLLCFMESWSP